MLFIRVLAAAGMLIALTAAACQAAVVDSFDVGPWRADAFTKNSTGRLSACIATADYRSGITLHVLLDAHYSWAIAFSSPEWNMTVDDRIPLEYRIDSGAWRQGTAIATTERLARLEMPADSYILTRFRRGRVLYVRDEANSYGFNLTDTSRLMIRMADCVDKNTALYGAEPRRRTRSAEATTGGLGRPHNEEPAEAPTGGLGRPQNEETAEVAVDPKLSLEATEALVKFMSSAGIGDLELIPEEERPEGLQGLHAVAAGGTRMIFVQIFEPGTYTNENLLMSGLVADSQEGCDGDFTSGTERTTVDGKGLFTSYCVCDQGDSKIFERIVIVTRKAGGIFVYAISDIFDSNGSRPPVSPPEMNDPDLYPAAASATY
ncbi:hypothetical protein FMN50_21200 [Rhodobacterales bacterium]|nr:hypothetical protein FMN50_21200 [Rhodobacterales bacterium]